MMQVWLVLLGAVLLREADKWAAATSRKDVNGVHLTALLVLLGYGCLVISVVLVFVNGGTTG